MFSTPLLTHSPRLSLSTRVQIIDTCLADGSMSSRRKFVDTLYLKILDFFSYIMAYHQLSVYLYGFILILKTGSQNQRRAEDFRIGVALTLFARKFFLPPQPELLSTTPNFRIFGVALRIRCGVRSV